MVKKIVGIFLIAFFMHEGSALFGMEGQVPEIAELGVALAPLDTPLPRHYSLSASFSAISLREAMEVEARIICQHRYHTGEELARMMLEYNRFNLPAAMTFVEYGADLNHALQLIVNGKLKLEDARTWALFCLSRGAQIEHGSEEVIREIVGERTRSLLLAIQDGGNYTVSPDEIQEIFLLAAGQGNAVLLNKILNEHRKLIPPQMIREAFINAAGANHEPVLRVLYQQNKAEMKYVIWRDTFSYALLCTALRRHLPCFNLIIERSRGCIYRLDLKSTLKQMKVIVKLDGLPQELLDDYLKIFAALEDQNSPSSRGDSFEPLLEPSTLIIRSSNTDSSGRHHVTEISIQPMPEQPELSTPSENGESTPRAGGSRFARRRNGHVPKKLLKRIFDKKHNREEKN